MYSKKHPLTHNQKNVILHNLNHAKKLPNPDHEWTFDEVDYSKSFHHKLTSCSMIESVRKLSKRNDKQVWRTKQTTWEYLKEKQEKYNFELESGESRSE